MSGGTVEPVRLSPRRVKPVELSRTQFDIWTSQRLHPDTPLANMGTRSRIHGRVDSERFVRAFDAVIRHCDVLRAVMPDRSDRNERPSARILAVPPALTEVVDLPLDQLEEWCADRISTPIDATQCMYDSVLLRHTADDWTWWLDVHHLATDAWGSALIFEATSAVYLAGDDPVDLSALIDGDFFRHAVESTWDVGPLGAAEQRAAEWQSDREAAGPQPPIELYGSRGVRTTAVRRVPVPLGTETAEQLESGLGSDYRTLSRELGLLTIAAMTSAIAVHRLDGRSCVVLGVPVHHRRSRAAKRIVGPLMELYPLTVCVDAGETHRAMFARVLRSITTLLRRARPGESPATPFEIVLNVLTARYGDFAEMPTTSEWMRSGHVDPSHVVRSQIFDYAAGRDGSGHAATRWELDLNESLSSDDAALRFPEHFASIVSAMLRAPDGPIGQQAIVANSDLAELALLSPDPVARGHLEPVHEQVRRAMREDPAWIVAEHRDAALTAGAFDERADRFAVWLLDAGLARGRTVGLRMPRSLDVLVAIHGVLRAGGVFVMLSPDDPPARHRMIEADADLFAIIDELPDLSGSTAGVDLPAVELDDGAYVLYTSGSTGVPKGVPISHRGLSDYLRFAVEAYVGPELPVVALHSSLVFDLTITSLFVSLLAGGRVVVFDEEPITALGRIAADDRITWLKATPSQLELFVRLAETPRPLRTIVVGGEAFRRPIAVRTAESCLPGVRIFNEYGPTEAVVGCMIHEWIPDVDIGPDVPIGHAAPGCEIRVLDANGQLTPSGAWGELYVRRAGMAQGYLNRPDLSAERFVRLDERDEPPDGNSARWYRTGDLVRVVRPGVTVYGGRMDDQLKVNGIRLEPAEVEAALVTIPGITTALVRVWHPGDARPTLDDDQRCARCGLGIDVPGVDLDGERICNVCRSFDLVEPQAQQWFRTEADLDRRLEQVRSREHGEYDCLHLLSGGKDSTYALYQLVDRGWRVHALTLDNGYISEGAKQNIRRTVADLGITHEFASTPAMQEIFRDSLDRYSNVCQGCYKTIYTLGVARAHQLGIPVVVTGLSRGQFFETRLVPHQFERGRFDPDAIDETVLEARRVYHQTPDAVTQLLPEQRLFDDGSILDEIEFLDFYRYVDVDLAELYRYLEQRAPWVRPADTGRSTNCLINVAGIQVHRAERGYHNYAEPYSWDVRLGHKTRDEALDELDDEVDDDEVARLLAEVGYEPKLGGVLTAWYQSVDGSDLNPTEIRRQLRDRLPEHAVPSAYVRLDELPLAASAKADPSLLPAPTRFHRHGSMQVAPSTPIEDRLCEIWAELLGLDSVGVTDDFFDLGGASLEALETVAAIDAEFGTDLPDAAVFRARTVGELAIVVEQALGGSGKAVPEQIPTLGGDQQAPISSGEEAMLFDYRMAPEVPRYNVTRAYRLRHSGDGPAFDHRRFAEVVGDLVRLHGPLHTAYGAERRSMDVHEALLFVALPEMSAEQFDEFATVQRAVPFDLDHGPLVRVHVSTTGPNETSILIGMHHISIDAGTFDVLWAQIADRYERGILPELPIGYADHTDWQRRTLGDVAGRYWQQQSQQRHPIAHLGLAAPRPIEPDGYLSRTTAASPNLLVGHRRTPFSVAMAAAAVVLSRFSATDQVEFGITASTKDHAAAADLVGYYLNTLPMDLEVGLDDRFGQVIERATMAITDALPHRTYPFASIVRDARAAGLVVPDVSYMLAYEALATPSFPNATAEHRILASGVAVADVTFFVQERVNALEVGIEYRGSVIGQADAERMLGLFESVLLAGAADPDLSVGSLVVADVGHELGGDPLGVVDDTVLDRFVAHVVATPDAVAVTGADGSTRTYRDLAVDIERMAAHTEMVLSGRPARRIGVSMRRAPDLMVGILTAQALGAAYVPLDPAAPPERLNRIAAICGLDAVLTDDVDPSATAMFGVPAERVITPLVAGPSVDRDDALVDSLRRRIAGVQPDQVAYVIFTSGSTGEPRGVEVSHHNLAASIQAREIWYQHRPARFLVTPSIGFDSSIVGLFWPLATGGTVVLAGDDDVRNVDRIAALISDHSVTHVLMVPSLYRAVLERSPGRLTDLEMVVVAGESCPHALVELHERWLPGVELVNEYGPTEATVWATAHRLRSDQQVVAIGGPIPGTAIRAVDARLGAVPEGVAGELLISGPGVAVGYLGDPVATAERFVTLDERRWYRTGDVVRFRNGVAEFVGRVDDQLNVGGNRLEPGEVEAALTSWPEIRDAVVVAALQPPVLVAHVEADSLDEPRLRAELSRRLPAGSIPRHFVLHDALPRTSHGKIDRAAAAALAVGTGVVDVPKGASQGRGEVVDRLVATWRSVFERADIDERTDFFDIGGDSLAAVQVVTAVGQALGRVIPISALLAGRTPAGLAAIIDESATGGERSPSVSSDQYQAITLRPGDRTGPLVLMTPAWDDIFGYQELAHSFPETFTVVALVYVEQPDVRVVTRVDELTPEFLPLAIGAIGEHSSVAVLGWSVGGVVAATLADELALQGVDIAVVALIDTFFPGEERHLWSNRWWKYKSMLRPGAFGEAGRELRVMGVRRVKRLAARLGRRLLLWSGASLPDEPERTSVGGFPVEALGHRIERVSTPLVFYRATTTNPERTLNKWRTVAVEIVDVEVPGRHRGFDSIMGEKGVGLIATDLSARLVRR